MDALTETPLPVQLPASLLAPKGSAETRHEQAGGGWALRQDHVDTFAWASDYFTPAELDNIVALGRRREFGHGKVGNGEEGGGRARDSFVSWVYPSQDANWLFEKMAALISEMNANHFGFDLWGLAEGFQYTEYHAPSGHYHTHVDRMFGNPVRKLSLSVQLSAPDDYEGGDLQIITGGDDDYITIERDRGIIAGFPSFQPHRVTPVTKGTRCSLVAWVSGPPFR